MMNEFACSIDQSKILVKGKRTKRQRPTSPYGGMASSSSINSTSPTSSTTTPSPLDVSESSEEDQDMANCLILLAQGDGDARKAGKNGHDGKNMDGNYVYECKTCNRTFPSFQALGGHRASHRKPKMMNLVEDKKNQEILVHSTRDEIVMDKIYNPNTPSPSPAECSGKMLSKSSVHLLQINKKANKIHECLICRTEFTSGQALGGHMRRHRAPSTGAAAAQISLSSSAVDSSASSSGLPEDAHDVQKPRNVLSLDLNLPAPEDDQRDTKFQFVTTQKSLVFTSPALVGCRY